MPQARAKPRLCLTGQIATMAMTKEAAAIMVCSKGSNAISSMAWAAVSPSGENSMVRR